MTGGMNERTFHASQAHKLDDPQRKAWLPPQEVLAALRLRPPSVVADIGAGTGYFSLPLADAAETARVYAVDLQAEMLRLLEQKLSPQQAARITLLEGRATALPLAGASCDLVLMANLWHELDGRPAVLAECRRILREQGRVAILDWRPGVAQPPGPSLAHRIPMEAVVRELEESGWKRPDARSIGEYSYLVLAEA